MSEHNNEDATPYSNQCLLLDQFLTCLALKELTDDETTALYNALIPHVRECRKCAENLGATEGLVINLRDATNYQ